METRAIQLTYVPGNLTFGLIDPTKMMSENQLKRIAEIAADYMRPGMEGSTPRIEEYLHYLRQIPRRGCVGEDTGVIPQLARLSPATNVESLLMESFNGCYRLQRFGSDSAQHEYGLYGRLNGKLKLLPLKIVYQDSRDRVLSIQYPVHGGDLSIVLEGSDSRCQFYDALARLGLQIYGDGRYHHSNTRPDLIEARLAAENNPNDYIKATTLLARNSIRRHCRNTLQLHEWYSYASGFFADCTKVNMKLNVWGS